METLSPRQRDCLHLVWTRQATSKEIAVQLGIRKSTVDGYIAEAVEALGARDRRDAARRAFGDVPVSAPQPNRGADPARVAPAAPTVASAPVSTGGFSASRPWRVQGQRNAMTLAQTLGWIAIIAFCSLAALSLAASIGAGLPSVAVPVLKAFDRLTH